MGGDIALSKQEPRSAGHLSISGHGEEADGDARWLLWDATLLATALDSHQHTQIMRDFPDFSPWAFASGAQDSSQQQRTSRLLCALCIRLLQLLPCQMKSVDFEDLQAASK